MKSLKTCLGLFLAALLPQFASAALTGPYAPDASTLHLYHFDETTTPVIDYAPTGGTNLTYMANGATLGNASYATNSPSAVSYNTAINFGTLTTSNSVITPIGSGNVGTPISFTYAGAGGAFTYEAIVQVQFNPTNNYTVTPNRNQPFQIINCDADGTGTRVLQFRIDPVGFAAGGRNTNFCGIEFINGTTTVAVAPIPTNGPDAIVSNAWYHVAVSYNGTPNTTSNLLFYWTLLDPNRTAADLIYGTNMTANLPGTSTDTTIFTIGNSARNPSGGTGPVVANFLGNIDEVRMSSVARAAGQMAFYPPTISFTTQPAASQTIVTNQTASLTAVAAGQGTITYQWYSFNATSTNALLNQTNTTLTVTAGSTPAVDDYFSVASNGGISSPATSSVATVTIIIPPSLTWTGSMSADWDTTTANWTGGSTIYADPDLVTFDSTGIGQPTVNLTANVAPTVITVNADGYSLGGSGAGAIVGLGSLVENGGGTLTLTASNTFSGGTTINGGTVSLSGNGQLGTGPVVNNGSIVANTSGTVDFPAAISGSGSLSVIGGAVSLDVSNSFTGSTTISGEVYARNGNSFGNNSSGTTVNSGGQIYFTAGVNFGPVAFTISGVGGDGNGAFRKGGSSASTLFGTVAMTADTTIGVDSGSTLTLSNTLSGTANLTMTGSGTLNLSADNNYNGTTTVTGGTLGIVDASSLGVAPGSLNAAQLTLSSATLSALDNVSLTDGNRGLTINTAGGFFVASNATLTVANPISGSAVTITKSSPGTLVLEGDNSATLSGVTLDVDTANTTSSDGNTVLASPNAMSSASLTVLNIRNNNAGSSTLQLDGTSGAITVAPVALNLSGRNNLVPAVESLTGNNTFDPQVSSTYVVGGSTYQFTSDAGTLTIGPTLALPTTAPNGNRVTMFSGNGNIVVSSVIQDSAISASLTNAVLKTGSGTLTLSAANTYIGSTTISNGVLLVDGSIAAGNGVTCVGGSLGGSGVINSAVSILPGAALAPGDAGIGTLTINNNLNLAGNLAIDVNKSLSPSQSNDLVVVSGVLTNSGTGTVNVSNLGGALVAGDRFVLFSQAVSNGAAMTVTGSGASWNNNLAVDGSISVASTIATNPTNLVATVSGGNLTLNWPADHTGWQLQAQTNSLATGLSNNWVLVPGSTAVNSMTIPINAANGAVFYRLALAQ